MNQARHACGEVLRETAPRGPRRGLALALALSGCGKGSSSDSGGSDGKTIRFVAAKYDDDTQAYWTALIKDFEKANPGYRVNLEVVDWEQMDSKVKTYVQTKQEPDILNYNKFSDFARDGLVHKAQDVVSPKVLADFLPLFRQKAQYKGPSTACPSSPARACSSTTRTSSPRRA